MNRSDFHSAAAGRVVRARGGYLAFIPASLPPPLDYDAALVRLLSEADAALSELAGLGRNLPNHRLLIAPYVRREAVLSSRIEGTRASIAEVLIDERAGSSAGASDDVREVRNYVGALEHGIRRLDSLPLSLRLVRELHQRLLRGVRGDSATPGEFRRTQNWIGAPGSTLEAAIFVPPPAPEPERLKPAKIGSFDARASAPLTIEANRRPIPFTRLPPPPAPQLATLTEPPPNLSQIRPAPPPDQAKDQAKNVTEREKKEERHRRRSSATSSVWFRR